MEDPIVFSGHAQKRHVVVGPCRILGFKRIRLLGEELRRRTADLNGDLAIVLVGGVVQRVQSPGKIRDLHVGHNPWIVQNGGVCGDLDQRQRRLVQEHAGAVVLIRRGVEIHCRSRGASLGCSTSSVGGALTEAGVHNRISRHVDQQPVVPIVRVRTILPHDVLLAAPVLARAVGERVMTCEAMRHLHGDGPNPISILIAHGEVARESKIATPRQKHAF